MGLRTDPVVIAGLAAVGVPVLAAALVAGLTIQDHDSPSASPSTAAAASGSATPAPESSPPPPTTTAPKPVGFQPDSFTFATADEGWVLGRTYPCTSANCRTLQHTTDGGQTWKQLSLPAPLRDNTKADLVALTFTDRHNGWLTVDDQLYSTHDGGAAWHPVDVGLRSFGKHWTLSLTADAVHITGMGSDNKVVVMMSSPLDSENWSSSSTSAFTTGGGPVPLPMYTGVGERAWLMIDNRGVTGSRLVGDTWVQWTPPCGNNGPASWHAFTESRLVALCGQPGFSENDPATSHLMTSRDGGATFTETGQVWPSVPRFSSLIPADTTHLVAAIDNQLLTSSDGGTTWTTTWTDSDPEATIDGEFVSATTGFVVVGKRDRDAPSTLLTTHDAGRTWEPVLIP